MALIINNVQSAFTFDELAVKPSAPAAGKLSLYAKNDGFLYTEDNAGTETQVGASGGTFPANQIVYGTGTGSTSEAEFTWNPTTNVLQLGSVAVPPTIRSPNGVTSNGTDLILIAGNGDPIDGSTSAIGGAINLTGGNSSRRVNGGDINLTGGDLLNDINAGKSATVAAGSINLIGGTASGTGDKTVPGSVSLTGGSSNQTDGVGGDVSIMGGLALIGDGTGGNVGIAAADAAFLSNGIGGTVTMYAGQGFTFGGGGIDIRSGDATTGTAGTAQLSGGRAGPGGGIAGNVVLWGGHTLSAATTPSEIFIYSAGNKLAHSNGDFDNNHILFLDARDAIAGHYISRNFTTDGVTITELFLDGHPYAGPVPAAGYSRQMVLPNNSSWRFEIHLIARRTDAANETTAYEIKGAIDRQATAATTAIVGTVSYNVTADDSAGAWTILVDADTTSGALRIRVTGQAAKTIRWVAVVRTAEVMN